MKLIIPLLMLLLTACAPPMVQRYPNFVSQHAELNQLVTALRRDVGLPGSVDIVPVAWGNLSPPLIGWAQKGVSIIVDTSLENNEELLSKVLLHEMGHQFGLGHVDVPCHIMAPTTGSCTSGGKKAIDELKLLLQAN